MLSTNKQAKSEHKEAKAEAKAEKKAAKIAARSVVVPMPIFGDFTEEFDKAAYDADKQAIADAEAKAKADAAQAKADKKSAKAEAKSAKAGTSYDKATDEQLTKMERKSEMLSTNEQATAENKERKAEAKAEKKAAKIAAKSVLPPVVLFGDFTENFDKTAYDADKQAIADAEAKAKADKAALKLEKKAASEAKEEAKISTAYDKATGEQLAKMERKAEYAVFLKQADEDKKQVKAVARAKAEEAKVVPVAIPETNYNDPELLPVDRDAEELEEATKLQRAIDNAEKLEGKKEIKLASRNQKDLKATEKLESKYANAEMLEYASQYKSDLKKNKKQLAKAEERGKFMLEYGSTYDPEWDGEFNNYGLPKVDPYTAGIKLSTSRQRSQKREKLSNFDEKKLSTLSRMQCDTDNQMIAARVHSQFADLELEVAKAEQDFSGEFRNGKEKRWLRENKKKLKSLKARVAVAEKYERLDNERYYSVVATNFEKAELHARADRDDLIAMREELMRLLDVRDEINAQLIQLYTGAEKGDGVNHIRRRNRVVLKARKRAHAKYRKYYNALNKYRVTRNEKMRIFDKLDEIVERSGDLAKAKYILRKEKPIGKARREYVREKGNAKSNIRYAKRYVNRFTAKAVRRAKRRQRRTRALIATLVLLAILGVAAFTVYLIGPQLLEAVKPKIPANFHQYIDKILSMWPRR